MGAAAAADKTVAEVGGDVAAGRGSGAGCSGGACGGGGAFGFMPASVGVTVIKVVHSSSKSSMEGEDAGPGRRGTVLRGRGTPHLKHVFFLEKQLHEQEGQTQSPGRASEPQRFTCGEVLRLCSSVCCGDIMCVSWDMDRSGGWF